MPGTNVVDVDVRGPWSIVTSKRFWEGFSPNALSESDDTGIDTVFCNEADWTRTGTRVTQHGRKARIELRGPGDLDAAAGQVQRFLSLDVDAREWPEVGRRDAVIGRAQQELPGLRPCGFHSPYEAAAWSVVSQRVRIVQGAALARRLIERFGDDGAFPAPTVLRAADLDLPGRKPEYLQAVADAALEGRLDGVALRAMDPADAIASVQQIKGVGPFAAELIVLRGAQAPDAVPSHERRLEQKVVTHYGPDATIATVSDQWRPLRTWAAVHLRSMSD